MKKNLLAFILIFFSPNIFALGIGPSINFATDANGFSDEKEAGISCFIKTDDIPLSIGINTNYDFENHFFEISQSIDYIFWNPKLVNHFYFFTGIGEIIGMKVSSSKTGFKIGGRIALGLNFDFCDGYYEPFIQTAIQSGYDSTCENGFLIEIPVNIGLRIHF